MVQFENILARIESIQKDFGFISLTESIEACRFQLAQKDIVQVGVFGRFKSGKSSLINALIGTQLLPVGALPVTAIVTCIRYAPSVRAHVVFANRSEKDIDPEQIADFVSEHQNPCNQKGVSTVFIETPGLLNYRCLEFLDTPGLGSVHGHNSDVTRQWIPRSGVALMAVSADEPLSESDLALIGSLMCSVPRLAVVLTKADRLTNEELPSVIDYIHDQIQRHNKADIPVFPFCSVLYKGDARPTLWRKTLDEQWFYPLVGTEEVEREHITQHKIRNLIDQASTLVTVALQASMKTTAERDQIRKFVLEEDHALPIVRRELFLFGHAVTSGLMERTLEVLVSFQPQVKSRVLAEFDRQWQFWHMNISLLTHRYEDWLRDFMAEEMTTLSEDKYAELIAPVDEINEGLKRIVLTFRDRLASRTSEALGVDLALGEHVPEIATPKAPDVKIGKAFDIPLDILWVFIPVTILRPLFRRHFVRQICWEIEKHLSRLATQWTEAIRKGVSQTITDEEAYVQNLVKTIEGALIRTDDQSDELRRVLDELGTMRDALESGDVRDKQKAFR